MGANSGLTRPVDCGNGQRVISRRTDLVLLGVIYLGFISLGLPDGTLGVAWPQAHRDLQLPIGVAGTITVVLTILAAFSGFSSGRINARFKTGPVVLVSCVLTGSALVLLSQVRSFPLLLLAAVPLGLGSGAVDAGLNGYVARHYTGRHMNWLHACWGIGATGGPLLMAAALGRRAGWRGGYALVGSLQLSLAVVFLLSLPLWSKVPERAIASHAHNEAGRASMATANSFAGWLSAAIFAVYVAVEMTLGLWASSVLVESRGLTQEAGGFCTTAYYGAITVGRIVVGTVVDRWGNRRLVLIGGVAALTGATLFALAGHTPATAAGALVITGLGFAPIYPCLMHEVPRRFAPDAVQVVIGRQSGAAYIGAAMLPAIAGMIAQVRLEAVPWTIAAGVALLIAAVHQLNRAT